MTADRLEHANGCRSVDGTPAVVVHLRGSRGISHVTGTERYILTLVAGLDRDAWRVQVLCVVNPRYGPVEMLEALRSQPVTAGAIGVDRVWSPRDVPAVIGWIRRHRVALLHTHDHRADLVGLLAGRLCRIPIIATAHGWTFPTTSRKGRVYRALDLTALRRMDRVIANSAATRKTLMEAGLPPDRVRLIPHGVDTEAFHPARLRPATREALLRPGAALLVGMVGHFAPVKGQREFLRAAEILHARQPGRFTFLVVGDAPCESPDGAAYRAQVVTLAAPLYRAGVIRFLGARQDIPELLAAMDIVVIPSLAETASFVAMEAQACGRPVVASRVGGMAEAVAEGRTGLLVPPGDVGALADAVEWLAANAEVRERMGQAARAWITREFAASRMVRQVDHLYRELVPPGLRGTSPAPSRVMG